MNNVTDIRAFRAEHSYDIRRPGLKQLREAWKLVHDGLEQIVRKTRPKWLIEDIYGALRREEAVLWLGYEDLAYRGFAIVFTRVDPFTAEKVLVVWALYANAGAHLDPFIGQVLERARAEGADRVYFQSPRRAWQRRLARFGFMLTQHEFELQLGVQANG